VCELVNVSECKSYQCQQNSICSRLITRQHQMKTYKAVTAVNLRFHLSTRIASRRTFGCTNTDHDCVSLYFINSFPSSSTVGSWTVVCLLIICCLAATQVNAVTEDDAQILETLQIFHDDAIESANDSLEDNNQAGKLCD